MEPFQQSHPHPVASNFVTEAPANSGSPSSPMPLQEIPYEVAGTHHHVANNGTASSLIAAEETDLRQSSDEEEELNNSNNNQKKQQEAFLNSFPPGYRFRPRDEELVQYYLQRKIMDQPLPPNKIMEVNLYRHNPETLAGKYDTYEEKEWYFFTPRDRKYPNGQRPNRRAGDGYWKATGADKPIKVGEVTVGFRKALVFYRGRPPKGKKTNWIMHEFRVLDSRTAKTTKNGMRLDNWVLCRIYKKADSKNKIQTQNHEADPAEKNISVLVPDDTEIEMNYQVDNTRATESEEEYPHTIAHPPLAFDRAYPNVGYHHTLYLGEQPLNNNMLHHHPFQPIAWTSKGDNYANMFYSPPTCGSSSAMQFLDDHKPESMVLEEASDQKYDMQFPNQKFMQFGQKHILQSPDGRQQTKTHSPGDVVESRVSRHQSLPCVDQKSIQQDIGEPLLSPPSDGLRYCIEESNHEHDNLFLYYPDYMLSEASPSWP